MGFYNDKVQSSPYYKVENNGKGKQNKTKNIGSWLQIKAKVNSSADPRDIFKHTSKTLLDTSTFLFHLG